MNAFRKEYSFSLQRNMIQIQSTESGKTAHICYAQWKLLGRGSSHLVFHFVAGQQQSNQQFTFKQGNIVDYKPDQIVFIINYSGVKKPQNARLRRSLNQIHQTLLKEISEKKGSKIWQFVQKTRPYVIRDKQQAKMLASFVNEHCKLQKKIQQIRQIHISNNLMDRFTFEWDFLIEFKPKSPLPDYLSTALIDQVALKCNTDSNTIRKIINQSSFHEKTRHFKKSLIIQMNKKPNANPLMIFDYQLVPSYLQMKGMKQFIWKGQTTDIFPTSLSKEKFNSHIQKALHQSGVLSQILSLQMFFMEPLDSVSIETVEKFQKEKSFSQQEMIVKLSERYLKAHSQNLMDSIRSGKLNKTIIDSEQIIAEGTKRPIDELQKICQSLISKTWRDVSIIIVGKMDEQGQLGDHRIRIIDYQLKEVQKVQKDYQKQVQLLAKYIQYKLQGQKSREGFKNK